MRRASTLFVSAALALALSGFSPGAARAQAGDPSGFADMERFAPMLEMMKKRMGKKRFARLMQTFGPMMSEMMEGGGGGGYGGFGPGGFAGYGGYGGFDMNAMSRMIDPAMIAGMVSLFDGGDRPRGRRQRR